MTTTHPSVAILSSNRHWIVIEHFYSLHEFTFFLDHADILDRLVDFDLQTSRKRTA